jgi:hypothetical protein
MVTGFGRRQAAITTREKRRSERQKANSPAFVETPASRQTVTVVDFSATGARLISSSTPPSRRDVCLNVNGLTIFGTIAWRRGNSFGLKFEESLNEIDPSEFQRALDEAQFFDRNFDRESVLKDLANKEPVSVDIDENYEI